MIEREFVRRNIRVNSLIDIDSLEPIVELVAQGLGASVVPEQFGSNPPPPNIRRIPFGNPPLTRQLGIIYQQSSTKEKMITLLHDELYKLSGSPSFSDTSR